MYHNERGFTLIELMITLAIFAIIAAMAAPNMVKIIQNYKLKETVVNLKATILEARARSLLVQHATIVCPNKKISDPTVTFTPANCGALLAGYAQFPDSQKEASVVLAAMNYNNLKFSSDSAQSITFDRFGKTTQQKITLCNAYRSFVVEVFIPGNLTITEQDGDLC